MLTECVLGKISRMRMAVHLSGLPSKSSPPQSSGEKNIRWAPADILQTTWPVRHKTVRDIKTKKYLRRGHSQEEHRETWKANAVWDPGWDPGTGKGYRWKPGNENKLWTSANTDVPYYCQKPVTENRECVRGGHKRILCIHLLKVSADLKLLFKSLFYLKNQ